MYIMEIHSIRQKISPHLSWKISSPFLTSTWIDDYEVLWITHFFLIIELLCDWIHFFTFEALAKGCPATQSAFPLEHIFLRVDLINLASFTISMSWEFPKSSRLDYFWFKSSSLSLYPLAFYYKQQKATRLHFQQPLLGNPSWMLKVIAYKFYFLYNWRTQFHWVFCHSVTRISFPLVSNNIPHFLLSP